MWTFNTWLLFSIMHTIVLWWYVLTFSQLSIFHKCYLQPITYTFICVVSEQSWPHLFSPSTHWNDFTLFQVCVYVTCCIVLVSYFHTLKKLYNVLDSEVGAPLFLSLHLVSFQLTFISSFVLFLLLGTPSKLPLGILLLDKRTLKY